MADAQSLVPIEQKEVAFYEDQLIAVRLANGDIYVPAKPICELLGVDWGGQYRRIQRDAVLSDVIRSIDVTSTDRGTRPMVCLPLDFVSGFLFGLNAARVKPELRQRVILYQRECYTVLSEAFREGRLTADPAFDALLQQESESVQAYKMLQAMVRLARQQVLLEARQNQTDVRLDNYEQRLEAVEATLGDANRHVSVEQAMQLSQAVKAVALAMSKRSGRNEFGGVYGELYRRFEVTSYKEIPARRYREAMAFLNEWYQSLTQTELPF
ncbi:MAG: ORF6C domain-containing protein [Anaerolineales bacterium]|nr:ORF6C domain-containing protein [Anaerolineales bacterium]